MCSPFSAGPLQRWDQLGRLKSSALSEFRRRELQTGHQDDRQGEFRHFQNVGLCPGPDVAIRFQTIGFLEFNDARNGLRAENAVGSIPRESVRSLWPVSVTHWPLALGPQSACVTD